MKNLIIVALICVLITSCITSETQDVEKQRIEVSEEEDYSNPGIDVLVKVNGYLWIQWGPEQKLTYLAGIITAHAAIMIAVESFDEFYFTKKQKEIILDWLIIEGRLKEIATNINLYYTSTQDYNAPIWAVMYFISGKSWWNKEKNDKFLDFEEKSELTKNEKNVIINL